MNNIVDSHCHLNFKDFENDLDAVILRAQNNGVNFLLTISINLEDFNIQLFSLANDDNLFKIYYLHKNI